MKTKILVVGSHEEMVNTLIRLIHQNPQWEGVGAGDEEEALRLFDQQAFDLVLLSSGIADDTEQRLRSTFALQNPATIIIQHYGGGSGLLTGEIRQALENRE